MLTSSMQAIAMNLPIRACPDRRNRRIGGAGGQNYHAEALALLLVTESLGNGLLGLDDVGSVVDGHALDVVGLGTAASISLS